MVEKFCLKSIIKLNKKSFIKNGGGTGPMKPSNLLNNSVVLNPASLYLANKVVLLIFNKIANLRLLLNRCNLFIFKVYLIAISNKLIGGFIYE